jgi:hypothetical protein
MSTVGTSALRVMEISAPWLRERGARDDQLDLYIDTFGRDPILFVPSLIRRAATVGLNVGWGARHLLAPDAWDAYRYAVKPARVARARARASAREEYNVARAAAWDEFARACAAAWEDRDRVIERAQEAFDRTIAQALGARDLAIERADAEYRRACAEALISVVWGSTASDV